MNIFEIYRQQVLNAVNTLAADGVIPDGLKLDAITLEPPREASHGDLSTNAAMVLAGQAKMKPREIAQLIADELLRSSSPHRGEAGRGADLDSVLRGSPHPNPPPMGEGIRSITIESVDIAGPGFINIRLAASAWHAVLPVILSEGTSFGNSSLGANKKVNVEYVSANPTGPMHVGHARGAVVGDALSTLLLKAGFNVTKEYYINDAGGQVDKVALSALLRYREACGEVIGEIPEGLYPGEYMKAAGVALREAFGDDLRELSTQPSLSASLLPVHLLDQARAVIKFSIDCMLNLIKQDLADLGIHHDVFTSEAALQKAHKIEEAIKVLDQHGLIYRGILEPPKGKTPDDWEAREQTLFRATAHGDDVDRPVQKSDGSYTYFAGDLALAQDKIRRGFNHQILVLGADHGGYVKRLKAAVSALSGGEAECHVMLCQLVHLYQNGEPFKMSKRAGTFITVRDVLDEVGKDILRFVMLMRKNDQTMDFDLAKVKEQSKDNPVFYVQYAHARAKSVLRMGAEHLASATQPNFSLLTHPAELTLVKLLAAWPRQVEQAALAHEPHRIIYYLQELAGAFHGLWNVGSKDAEIRFILPDNPGLTVARLALARALTIVVASGLNVCGVEPVEELR
jgi:arginyl-tRNA synthetase